jgi:hypothetical protein
MSIVQRPSSNFDLLSDDSIRQIFNFFETNPRKSVALASTCTRMRALAAKMRYPFCLQVTAPSGKHLLPSFKFYLDRNAHKFHAVEVRCKTKSLGTLRALHKATKDLVNARLCVSDDDGDTDITGRGDDLMSHLFQDIYEHLSKKGSKMVELLQELNWAVRDEDNVAIEALHDKIFCNGYDCMSDKKDDSDYLASWAWGEYIYTGEEDQLQISFHLWMEAETCKVSLEVHRSSDHDLLDNFASCICYVGQSSWLRDALELYRDVKKWENHPREEADGSDDEEHDEDDFEDEAKE